MGLVVSAQLTVDTEPGFAVADQRLVLAGKVAPGKAKGIDGIQQIGFSNPVGAGDPHDPVPEIKADIGVVLELGNLNVFQE